MAHPLLTAVGAASGLALGGLGWALIEPHVYTLRTVRVPVLPARARPLRVLHLSDLHLVPSQSRKRAWLRDLARLEPDVVVDTGDNLAHMEAVPAVLDALGPLLERPGMFVMGSNDYYAPKPKNPGRYLHRDPRSKGSTTEHRELPTDDLRRGLTDAGWVDLSNRRDSLQVGELRLDLVGVDDPHIHRDRFPARAPSTAEAGGAVLRVGVTHAPYRRILDRMHRDGAELILAGHTHGGQLCVPLYGALVTNCDLDRGRAKGLHGWPGPRPDSMGGEGSRWLHVSAGLGTSPYAPVRFACRPEATLLELVPRVAGD